LRQLDPSPTDIIADIGCGTGSFLALLGTKLDTVTHLMRALFEIVQ
jgi:precorrin-6B methylase 2